MMLGSINNAFMMRENFEILATGHGDKRNATRLRQADAGGGRSRNGGDDRRAKPCGLLNKFDRDPAGQKHEAMRGWKTGAGERTDELIECIMPSDILP